MNPVSSDKEINDKAQFVIALADHPHLGHTFVPYIVEPSINGSFYTIRSMVFKSDLVKDNFKFTEAQKKLVTIIDSFSDEALTRRFSRVKNSRDFYATLKNETLAKMVMPFVDKNMAECVNVISRNKITLFLKKEKYSNFYDEDVIELLENDAETVFNFDLLPDKFSYKLSVEYAGKSVGIINRRVIFVINDPCHMVIDHKMYHFKTITAKKISPFIEKDRISIPLSAVDKYMNTFVLNTIRDNNVEASGFDIRVIQPHKKAIIVFEKDLKLEPSLTLYFVYDNDRFVVSRKSDVEVKMEVENGRYIFFKRFRDKEWEQSVVNSLAELGLKLSLNKLEPQFDSETVPDRSNYLIINWLNRNCKELERLGIEVEKQADVENYYLGTQYIETQAKSDNDWFDIYITVQFDEFRIPFYCLRDNILNGRREFELPNGKIAILPLEWFTKYSSLLTYSHQTNNGVKLSKIHFALISELSCEFPEIVEDLKHFEIGDDFEIEAAPSELNASMRNYQQIGYSWMFHLDKHGFGGCLADDMGLGKTLQTIALLLKNKNLHKKDSYIEPKQYNLQYSIFSEEENNMPASLIVMPTSLIYNWHREIKKFAPSLKVSEYVGQVRKQSDISEFVRRSDVVLTTYGIVRNDIETMKNTLFNYVILDESQNIKNHDSKTYQAVCELKSNRRFVLTGTPIENSLSDLWSQFNFINQGLLGNYNFFKDRYMSQIEKGNGEELQKELRLLVRPYVLRRTKEEVATDLPPVTEQTVYCEMTKEQNELYENIKSTMRNDLMLKMEGAPRSKWTILAIQAMTRLRQLSNHPILVGEEDAGSGKFDEVMDSLRSVISENHKVLIFSSFVRHLNIFEQEFRRIGWDFSMLTGITSDRKKIIDEFQENPKKQIFLISLKAGGVGLNLTSADYIYILDPWWNPAAESQAISRAHRIGQSKNVFVYRFVTKGSIEEKIEILKERKLKLADEFINGNNPLKQIDDNEILELLD